MYKNLFKFIFNNKFGLKSVLNYDASCIGNSSGVNLNSREVPIVVSISYDNKDEIFDDLELSLYSLLNQTVCPDKIILWLSDKYKLTDLPYEITRYIKNGLEIKFCDNLNPYTKLLKAIKDNKNSIIVTAETNIFYPKNWLAKLYHSYISNPQDVHANRVHKLDIIDNNITPFKNWEQYYKKEQANYNYFPDNTGGILFPPKCFVSDIFRKDLYDKYVPDNYDIWVWLMSVISGRKIRLVKSHIKRFIVLDFLNRLKKTLEYNDIDNRISELMKYYGQNVTQKFKQDDII